MNIAQFDCNDLAQLNEIAGMLVSVDSMEGLKGLRETFPSEMLSKSAKILKVLNPVQFEQIKEWTVKLNEQKVSFDNINSIEELRELRAKHPPEILRELATELRVSNPEKFQQIKQWTVQLNLEKDKPEETNPITLKNVLMIGNTVEIIKGDEKGKRGKISGLKDKDGSRSKRVDGADIPYTQCDTMGFQWIVYVNLGSNTDCYYPDHLRLID
jgi:hypothetical protein